MVKYFDKTRKYAMTLGLTTGSLWLIGGLLGAYFSKRSTLLFVSALIIGGFPIITTLVASKFNIVGALLLITEATLVLLITYAEGINILIFILLILSYSMPIILSGIVFISFWYKNKTRI